MPSRFAIRGSIVLAISIMLAADLPLAAQVNGLPTESLGPSSRKTGLVISEIMYQPAPRADGRKLEYLEIYNSNPFFEDISGYRIAGDVNYTFPPNTVMQGNAFMVIAASPGDIQAVYGISNVGGPYTNSFAARPHNKTGLIQLLNNVGAVYLEVPYSELPPWPVGADGTGHSIVLGRPSYGEGDGRAWIISDVVGGSPRVGELVRSSPLRRVMINEFLAHTDAPVPDFIELYNHSNVAVDLSGCALTDDPATNKFIIPTNTIIAARGFISFDQNQMGFTLSAAGGKIYFRNPDRSRVLDAIFYEDQSKGVSQGRSPDGAGDFYPLSAPTPGAANSAIPAPSLVINEIMYNSISGDANDNYVELYNQGTNPVNLAGWRFNSGINFNFPANAMIPANGYLVVAANITNLFARYANLNSNNTVGDFSGKLSHHGDRLALGRPELNIYTNSLGQQVTNTIHPVVDEVTYGTGGRWGQWANGGGSSLELIDPQSNHRLAYNWADSDETAKAPWTNIETTGVLDNGGGLNGGPIDFVQIGLLEPGECLVDNIELLPGANGPNYISNPDFESGLTGWTPEGDHIRSSLDTGGYLSSSCLHLRNSDKMWTGANSVVGTLTNTTLAAGQTATLRFKARWLKGWPEPLLRVHGNWLEATAPMAIPSNLGTPGSPNSRVLTNSGPAIYEVTHSPTIPAASQSVVVTARFHDPNGLRSATLYYRIDPSGAYSAVPFADNGAGGDAIANDGTFSATIPGQLAGKLAAFYIQAIDTLGAATKFPADLNNNSPAREGVVYFGDANPAGAFGTYHLWLTQANVNRWSSLPDMSNESMDATWVYGPRVIYNMSSRYAGSPYHQQFNSPIGNPCHYRCEMPEDDKFLGATSFNKIHAPGNGPYDDDTIQREQTLYWILRQLKLPWNYRRYVNLYVNGVRRVNGSGTGMMEDTQVPDGDVIKEDFPNDSNGDFYKLQPWFEFDAAGQNFSNNSWCLLDIFNTTGGIKKLARYRWNYLIRHVQDSASRYTNVFNLVDAANLPANTAPFIQSLEAQADVEQWMRTFACSHSVGDWDHVGTQNAQNMYGYKPTQGPWTLLLWDCNIVLGNGSWSPGQNLRSYTGGDSGMANIYNTPLYQRALWGAFKEIANFAMDPTRINPMMEAKYNAFVANGINVVSPQTSVEGWVASARSSILSQIASANGNASFVVNGPASFNTNNNLVTLTGTAPVEVKTIVINGVAFPLIWSDLASWSLQFALSGGNNTLSIQGLDREGKLVSGAAATLTINYTGSAETPLGRVVINEIMYNPIVVDAEFVELYNSSTINAFDLSNFRLEGADFGFPGGTIILPGGFLVVVKHPVVFAKTYGNAIPIAGVYAGSLDPKGESLKLVQPGGTPAQDVVIDEVSYQSSPPWPAAADGFGPSLQLIDPAQDNRRVANWTAVTTVLSNPPQSLIVMDKAWTYNQIDNLDGINWTSPAYDDSVLNWSNSSPAIFYHSTTPQNITGGPLNTLVALTNNSTAGLSIPTYYFRAHFNYSGGLSGIELSLQTVIDDGAAFYLNGHEIFRLGMPNGPIHYSTLDGVRTISQAHPEGPFLLPSTYLVQGDNVMAAEVHQWTNISSDIAFGLSLSTVPNSLSAQFTPGAPNSVLTSLPPFPLLWLNEVQPNNVTTIADHLGQHSPWVELYNSGTTPINLGGYYLANNYSNLAQWPFPSNAVVGAGRFMVVYLDGNPGASLSNELHASFTIPPVSGSVALTQLSGNGSTLVDYLNYNLVNADRSFGAFPDANPIHRQRFYFATPGAPNTNAYPAVPIRINEWMAGNTSTLVDPADGKFDDWFELYNAGGAEVDLTGYTLSNNATNTGKFLIPAGYAVPANGYLLVWADKEPNQNSPSSPDLHINFHLGKTGDFIGLYAPNGTNVDSVTFGPQYSDISQGRWPDGDSAIYFMTNPTPRAANVFQATSNSAPVLSVINDRTANEMSSITFKASASDSDAGDTLSFSLDPGAPPGSTLNAASGIFNWTPTEAQGPGTYPITIRVTDNGIPRLSDARSFTITVNEVNRAPALNPLFDQTIPENLPFSFVATATDPDLPANILTFSLDPGAPPGASINPTNGTFAWTPSEAQGPSTNLVVVRVTDNGFPSLSAVDSFTLVVTEVNGAPMLSPITNQTVNAGDLLSFTARATDSDVPSNILTFTLDSGAPSGAHITPGGVFSWMPAPSQTSSTNTITVRVTDNGSPPLSDTKAFAVVVVGAPRISAITQSTNRSITLTWQTFAGKTYHVQYADSLTTKNWTDPGTNIVAAGSQASFTDTASAGVQRFYRILQVN